MATENPDFASGSSLENLSSDETATGYISGLTFKDREVTFAVVDGEAIFEGCIVLGRVEDLIRTGPREDAEAPGEVDSVVISGDQFRWPNGRVPFEIDGALPNQQRVRDALAHWELNTRMRFVERTPQNADQFPNFVLFTTGDGCSSNVGMRGDQQSIRLAAGCTAASTIHEIGHSVGLWHEQSREDRDQFVTINWESIEAGRAHNFNQQITDGDDVGAYDYNSIMHYGRTAFSRNGDTITPRDANAQIGQRIGLSPGDCAGVRWMYRGLEPTFPIVYSGVQFRANISASATRRWFTHSWPAHWFVLWTVVPTAPVQDRAAQLEWKHQMERQAGGLLKHYIEVHNLTSTEVSFEARYDILGWSLAFT